MQVSMCLMHPCCRGLLPSTAHNVSALVNIVYIHASGRALSISAKPRSAAHFPISMASTELQCLSVGARVHLVWFRAASRHVWSLPCINIFHASQLLASLGGCQYCSHAAQNLSLISPQLQPKSSSAAVEMREGSNSFSYQWVYLWFEMFAHSWHGTFIVYNHKGHPGVNHLSSHCTLHRTSWSHLGTLLCTI